LITFQIRYPGAVLRVDTVEPEHSTQHTSPLTTMMHSPYRDSPANSVADLQNYYDDGRVSPFQVHASCPFQARSHLSVPQPSQQAFHSAQDIPLTDTSRANRMDNTGAGYTALGAIQPPAGGNNWMETPEPTNKRAKWIVSSTESPLSTSHSQALFARPLAWPVSSSS
jgi:hypothetical protein